MRKVGILGSGLAAMLFLAGAANAATNNDLASAILACSAKVGADAQLACYNHVAATLKTGGPLPAIASKPPAPHTSADFGRDSMPFADHTQEHQGRIATHIKSVSYNFFHHFTVALSNGQVWRQIESDTNVARLHKGDAVTIARGFMDSFHLSVQGRWGTFGVKRIK